MKISEFKQYLLAKLSHIYSITEVHFISIELLEKVLDKERTFIISNSTFLLNETQMENLEKMIAKLLLHTPLQYVLGECYFFNLPFYVNSNVLIPRPETEELVEWVISDNQKNEHNAILDIGTGSGCIAISLAKSLTNSKVSAMDVSRSAINVAQKNCLKNEVQINFLEQDVLEQSLIYNEKWNVIVSNPPYIPNSERCEMETNVVDYEPEIALFVDCAEPLIFYKAISDFALKHLSKSGRLYFEIHKDFGVKTKKMLEDKGFKNVILREDISGNDRMIRAEI